MNSEINLPNVPRSTAVEPFSGDALRQRLKLLRDRRFLFVQPGGNWGDMLIYRGAEKLANELGLSWRALNESDFLSTPVDPDTVIYLHGSGGFNRYASGAALRILSTGLRKGAKTVIQGPMTIELDNDYVQAFNKTIHDSLGGAKLLVFAREQKTYDALRVTDREYDIEKNFDTAFYLDKPDLVAGQDNQSFRFFSFREDNESPVRVPLNLPGFVKFDPAYYANSFEHWVRLHAAAREIVTNRTHSAIIGAILGVPTKMFGNIYHKNSSIWEASLRERGVQWLDLSELDHATTWWSRLESALLGMSWKVRRLYRWFRGVPL